MEGNIEKSSNGLFRLATCLKRRLCFCAQESWYEFRVMAVMDDLISESSNVVGVSSTGQFSSGK